MHETMMNCLKKEDLNGKKQENPSEQVHQKEIQELQDSKKKLYEEFEIKNSQLKEKLEEKERKVKELEERNERLMNEKFQIQYSSDNEKKELQSKIHFLQNERDQAFDRAEFKSQTQVSQLQMELERLKLEHQREIEKIKTDFEQNLKEIKYFHDQEKHNLEYKLEKQQQEVLTLKSFIKSREDFNQDLRESQQTFKMRRENLESEVEFLQNEIEKMRISWTEQMKQLESEKKKAETQAQKLQKQLDKIKSAPQPIKIDMRAPEEEAQQLKQIKNLKEEVHALNEENEKLVDQIKKQRREIVENQDYIERMEITDRKLRQQIQDKSMEWENERSDFRKQLNDQKKKNLEAMDSNQRMRDSFEFSKNRHQQELLDKDDKIIKLTRELRDLERRLNENKSQTRNCSPFAVDQSQIKGKLLTYSPICGLNNLGFQVNSSINNHPLQQSSPSQKQQNECVASTQGMKSITQIEHTFLKTCQRMAEFASKMECNQCWIAFETSDFYDHIISEHANLNKTMNNISALGAPSTERGGITTHQTNGSTGYSSGFQSRVQGMQKKNFQEDIIMTNGSQPSPSPKAMIKGATVQGQNQRTQLQKFHQNSRSFTCLLNEIEEEEKQSSGPSRLNTQENCDDFSKQSPPLKIHKNNSGQNFQVQKQVNDYKRSRNANNSTVLMGNTTQSAYGYGNTIQSVQRTQREQYLRKKSGQNSKPSTSPMMACRTEIQNLKRENKKLSQQLSNHDSQIDLMNKDCEKLRKKIEKDNKEKNDKDKQKKLTSEIKDLLHKLVTHQGKGSIAKRMPGDQMVCQTARGVVRKKEDDELISQNKTFKKLHKRSPQIKMTNHSSNNSNKENKKFLIIPPNNNANYLFQEQRNSSELESQYLFTQKSNTTSAVLPTQPDQQMRKKEIAESSCKGSPTRFQNYFQALQDMPTFIMGDCGEDIPPKTNRPRYSPTKQSMNNIQFQKYVPLMMHHTKSKTNLTGGNSQQVIPPSQQQEMQRCESNQGLAGLAFNSKQTSNSSQHHLVLYDSSCTDVFKSKINKKSSSSNIVGISENKNTGAFNYENESTKKLEFKLVKKESDLNCQYLNMHSSSSCPSVEEFDQNIKCDGMNFDKEEKICSIIEENDPFVTGRFCQNSGEGTQKQFLFMQSLKSSNQKNEK